jgi:IS5 family transposase
MLRIAFPVDVEFLQSPLVLGAQRIPKFANLHDLLEQVWADKRVELAMYHDLVPPGSQALWNGRRAIPLRVTGNLAVVRHLMGWGYRTVAEEVGVSVGWRWVCQMYHEPMPDFRTIQGREKLLKPKTLRLINATVVRLGQAAGVTTGESLRLDSTVTETNIHFPTDSSLLDDSARVLSRLLVQARQVVQPTDPAQKVFFRDRHRQARHLARQIGQLARSRSKKGVKILEKPSVRLYAQLLGLVETLVDQVEQVQPWLAAHKSLEAEGLHLEFETYLPLVRQVVAQTRQRVLQGLQVPAHEKIVSLFEPHTYVICRGKSKPKETEFGHKLWFAEVDGGLISEYRILEGNPPDATPVIVSVKQHRKQFGKAPRRLCGDRGLFSPDNERQARALGVRQVALPQPGHKTARRKRKERQPWFRAALRFRNGIEARISQLRRARHLTRCLNRGLAGMERWVGWGVIANNLATIALNLSRRHLSLAEALA